MKNFIFDLETIPASTEQLQAIMPVFDPEEIKTGNMGPDKAAEKIEKARLEHANRFMRRAALSALSGQIAMLGIKTETETGIIDAEEPAIISYLFSLFEKNCDTGAHWIGFNIANFDIPFLLRRAWLHRIKVPTGIVRGRYLTTFFTDLLQLWNGPERVAQFDVSLNDLALFFGVGMKTGNGANFGELLRYEPEKAKQYLANDLEITWKVAEAMGAFRRPLAADLAAAGSKPDDPGRPLEPEPEPEPEPILAFY